MSHLRDTVSVGRLSVTGYPYIFYSPETEFAVGGALILTQRLSANPEVKPSNAMLSGYYSAKGSYDVFLNPEFFLADEKYYLGLSIDYYKFVDKFWGIGNTTPDIPEAGYIRKAFWLNIEFDVSVIGDLKLGMNYDLNVTDVIDKQMNPYLLSGDLTGTDGGVSSGIGGVLFADTRNGPFSPSEGGYYKLSFLNAGSWLGSTFTFSRWILDLRQYVGISKPLVVALQFYAVALTGSPPFYQLAALGGDNIERGYYEGRYRDKFYAAAQVEMRWNFWRRFGLIGWIGAGDVSSSIGDFRLTSLKPSFGIGLRFMLDPETLLNVRADFAYGRDSKGIYFNAKEAF
jgi:hypothetical protein